MTSTDDQETIVNGNDPVSLVKRKRAELEQMKERFAKLLLGEDMSGGGKGVSCALALSNAITNLAASAFGEQHKLAPMAEDRKRRWRREVGWLLSVTDYIVEFVPSQQTSKDGSNMEVMMTKQRGDLRMNIPALKKLDAMLIGCLDNFRNQNQFWYVSKDADESEKGVQRSDKWWLPTVKVPPEGLSEESRKWMQYQKDCVNQVLKASMAINAEILAEMEIPDNYIENLPKNGRESLGDAIYKNITVEFFDPGQFLSTMDLSSDINVLDLKNKIEASIVIWKRKMHQKDSKSSWSSSISLEKRELFEERAETILLLLKQQFPGLPQSSLEISKIESNKDVGHAILESYSRVLESLASAVMNRIEDVLYADRVAQDPSLLAKKRTMSSRVPLEESNSQKISGHTPGQTPTGSPTSMTLSDFMGWSVEQETASSSPKSEDKETEKYTSKSAKILARTKNSYMEKLEAYKLRSPTTRH
ncbi:Rho guanine nucleotide exchange factor 8-like protein [Tanacetum coccineum]